MIHELKCWPEFFQPIIDGVRNFEVRKDDRGFKENDILHLREWSPALMDYTDREVFRTVTYILEGGQLGIMPDFVVMALGEAPETTLRYMGLLKD